MDLSNTAYFTAERVWFEWRDGSIVARQGMSSTIPSLKDTIGPYQVWSKPERSKARYYVADTRDGELVKVNPNNIGYRELITHLRHLTGDK